MDGHRGPARAGSDGHVGAVPGEVLMQVGIDRQAVLLEQQRALQADGGQIDDAEGPERRERLRGQDEPVHLHPAIGQDRAAPARRRG